MRTGFDSLVDGPIVSSLMLENPQNSLTNSCPADPAIRVVLMPKDTNAHGTIFGGIILSHIDLAGAVEARKYTRKKFVTVAMREVKFVAPVFVGETVSFYARMVRIGTTSITINVTVEADRIDEPGKPVRVTEAEVIYVAIDEQRNPTPLQDVDIEQPG
jgi:acyl-CoA thioesterase YciA